MCARAARAILSAMNLGRRKLLLIGSGAVCAHALGCGKLYQAYGDLFSIMDLTEGLIVACVDALGGGRSLPYGDATVNFAPPFQRVQYADLFRTHAGCDISADGAVSSGSVQCFCHGSVFDGQGNVLRGPANAPLPHLVVTADAAGELTIHGDQTTPASTRLGT